MIHRDERGIIKDLIVTSKWSLTYITFNKGAVRGNHFHRHTRQIDFVWGDFIVANHKKQWVKRFGFCHHPAPLPHAYEALKPSKMLTFAWGERRGEDYQKDTYKLETPLL